MSKPIAILLFIISIFGLSIVTYIGMTSSVMSASIMIGAVALEFVCGIVGMFAICEMTK